MTPILATGGGKPAMSGRQLPDLHDNLHDNLYRIPFTCSPKYACQSEYPQHLPCDDALTGRKHRRVARILKIARHRRRPQIRLISANRYNILRERAAKNGRKAGSRAFP